MKPLYHYQHPSDRYTTLCSRAAARLDGGGGIAYRMLLTSREESVTCKVCRRVLEKNRAPGSGQGVE